MFIRIIIHYDTMLEVRSSES